MAPIEKMKLQEQKRKEPNGDCLRACIATLLEIAIDRVPDFVLCDSPPGSPYPGYWIALQGFLKDRGLWFLEMQLPPNQPWMPIPFDAVCIFFGETESRVKHAVIGRLEGGEFTAVFNPWPEAKIQGIGALGFILPRAPETYMKFGLSMARIERLAESYLFDQSDGRIESISKTAKEALGESMVKLFLPNGK